MQQSSQQAHKQQLQRDESDPLPPRSSSRLANLAPFRRSSLLTNLTNVAAAPQSPEDGFEHASFQTATPSRATQSSPLSRPLSSSMAMLSQAGGVADVPFVSRPGLANSGHSSSSSTSRIPFKPPKPAALRVKKAKALSISLLSHGSTNGSSGGGDRDISSKLKQRNPISAPFHSPTTLQEALAAEGSMGDRFNTRAPQQQREAIPPRSVSALDYYRENGPTKGLSQKEWPPQRPTAEARKNSGGVGQQIPTREVRGSPQVNEQLFIIGREEVKRDEDERQRLGVRHQRRRSTSLSLEAATFADSHEGAYAAGMVDLQPPPSPLPHWKLDTARELLSSSAWDPHSQAYNSSSPHNVNGAGKLHFRTSPRAAASPFLNTYSAQAKMQAGQVGTGGVQHPGLERNSRPSSSSSSSMNSPTLSSRIPRHKAASPMHQNHHLGKSDILRSTHQRMSTESSSSSSYAGSPSSPGLNAHEFSSHSRAASTSDSLGSPTRLSPNSRIRTQSHAFGISIDLPGYPSDKHIPPHPLSAQAPTFAAASGREESVNAARAKRDVDQSPALLDAGRPPVHPLRKKQASRAGTAEPSRLPRTRIDQSRIRSQSTAQPYTNSNANATSLQNLGQQIGGMSAAVGKRGWDMFKNWSASTSGPNQIRKTADIASRPEVSASANESTRRWLKFLQEQDHMGGEAGVQAISGRGIFGRPLREVVLLTRLGSGEQDQPAFKQISSLDFGNEFKIDLPNIDSSVLSARRASRDRPGNAVRGALDRQTARLKYLPAIVVRCIEAVEFWGMEEEGIYRLSGRASHTAKLRLLFDLPRTSSGRLTSPSASTTDGAALRLVEIGPAELDLNSICSVLKAYLRELPDLLIPEPYAGQMNAVLESTVGCSAVGVTQKPGSDTATADPKQLALATAMKNAAKTTQDSESKAQMSQSIAKAIADLMHHLPASNWYLLRELAMHLGDLTQPQVVAKTRMSLSNLCLILAPTLSLSVPMLHALVEQKTTLFDQSGPPSDIELDRLEVKAPVAVPSRSNFTPSIHVPRMSSSLHPSNGHDESDKRISMATVTDKRQSTSSVLTVQQQPSLTMQASTRPQPHSYKTLMDDDDPHLANSPIAAKYIRQRTASTSGSLDRPMIENLTMGTAVRRDQGRTTPSIGQASKMDRNDEAAFNFIADHESNGGSSSGPPSNDGFSSASSSLTPSTTDLTSSTTAPTIRDGLHSSSTASLGTYGPMHRPRPPTGKSAHFLGGRVKTGDRVATTTSKRNSKGISDFASTMSLKSSNSSLAASISNPGVSSSAATDYLAKGYPDKLGDDNAASTRMVDDSPMDVKAVRQWWSSKKAV